MVEITEREQLICKKLTELSEIYKSVKHIFLLVEYYNGKKGIVVSSINLRSKYYIVHELSTYSFLSHQQVLQYNHYK